MIFSYLQQWECSYQIQGMGGKIVLCLLFPNFCSQQKEESKGAGIIRDYGYLYICIAVPVAHVESEISSFTSGRHV